MAAKSTKGTKICLIKDQAAGTTLTAATAVSTAAPAEITVTNTLKAGDLVYLAADSTGFPEIDGKWWVVGPTPSATKFTLLGSDTSASAATFTAGTAIKAYSDTDMECICLSGITFNRDTPDTISTATFCDTTSSIPGSNTSAGSVDFTGYVNIADTDYKELLKLELSGDDTTFRVMLPGNGYIVFPATISQISVDIPLEGAVAYSGSASLKSAARHLF